MGFVVDRRVPKQAGLRRTTKPDAGNVSSNVAGAPTGNTSRAGVEPSVLAAAEVGAHESPLRAPTPRPGITYRGMPSVVGAVTAAEPESLEHGTVPWPASVSGAHSTNSEPSVAVSAPAPAPASVATETAPALAKEQSAAPDTCAAADKPAALPSYDSKDGVVTPDGVALARVSVDGLAPGAGLADDRFTVEQRLAQGATSTVYVGRQRRLDRQVALKVVERPPAGISAADLVQVEAQVAARVDSVHLSRVVDCVPEAPTPFVVFELLKGETVQQRIGPGRVLDPPAALAIAVDVLSGLAALHEAGFVHGDVTPDNVLWVPRVAEAGRFPLTAMLCDFGSARPLGATLAAMGHATWPTFVAPEQRSAGARAQVQGDIYGVGALLRYVLTGSSVWGGEVEQLGAELPSPIAALLQCALASDPRERFEDVLMMRRAIFEIGSKAARPHALLPARVAPRSAALRTAVPERPAERVLVRARQTHGPRSTVKPLLKGRRWVGGRTARLPLRTGGSWGLAAAGVLCLAAVGWSSLPEVRAYGAGEGMGRVCEVVDCDGLSQWGAHTLHTAWRDVTDWAQRGASLGQRWLHDWQASPAQRGEPSVAPAIGPAPVPATAVPAVTEAATPTVTVSSEAATVPPREGAVPEQGAAPAQGLVLPPAAFRETPAAALKPSRAAGPNRPALEASRGALEGAAPSPPTPPPSNDASQLSALRSMSPPRPAAVGEDDDVPVELAPLGLVPAPQVVPSPPPP